MSRVVKSFALSAAALFTLFAAASFAAHGPIGAFRSAKRTTVAPPSAEAPGWLCRAQRDAMGAAAFSQVWAGKANAGRSGMRKCVAYMTRADAQGTASTVEHTIMRAVATCKAARGRDPSAFRRRYGTNTGSSNALGRCVRSVTKLSARRVGR
jgi:hypothetical protein